MRTSSMSFAFVVLSLLMTAPTFAADRLSGVVLGAGAPIANATVTLWAASAGAPAQLGRARTGANGRFTLAASAAPASHASLYVVATGGRATANKSAGDNPAIALITVVGSKPRASVTINEMTTVASVWTHAQFLDGAAFIVNAPATTKIYTLSLHDALPISSAALAVGEHAPL